MAAVTGSTGKDGEEKSSSGGGGSKILNFFKDMKKAPIVSTGRGGAGNIGPSTHNAPSHASLATPTIKQPQYTTGRGGSGNMALNDPSVPAHAEMARAAQDVGAPALRQTEQTGEAFVHHGRGGGGNLVRLERVTSNSAAGAVINGEAVGEDGVGEAAEGGVSPRRGSTEKVGGGGYRGQSRGRRAGERGYELGNENVAGDQEPQRQQSVVEQQREQSKGDERQGSASRISGLMDRLRSPSASKRRSSSYKGN